MKAINLCILLMIVSFKVQAQEKLILTEIKYEGRVISLTDNFHVRILYENDTLLLKSTEKGFYLSDSLFEKQRTLLFNIGNQELLFDEIIVSWNPQYLHWTIDIDKRPFSDENKWLVKKSKKRVKWIYTLDKSTGSLLTFYRFEKLKKEFPFTESLSNLHREL